MFIAHNWGLFFSPPEQFFLTKKYIFPPLNQGQFSIYKNGQGYIGLFFVFYVMRYDFAE